MATELWAIGLVLTLGFIGGLAPVYLKQGSTLIKFSDFSTIYKNPFLIIGAAIYSIGIIGFVIALRGGELSVLYPLEGLGYVWVCVYSLFLLKERMTLLKWIGIFTIVIGVTLIGISI